MEYCSLMRMKVDDENCYECQSEGAYDMFKDEPKDVIEDMVWMLISTCIFREREEEW